MKLMKNNKGSSDGGGIVTFILGIIVVIVVAAISIPAFVDGNNVRKLYDDKVYLNKLNSAVEAALADQDTDFTGYVLYVNVSADNVITPTYVKPAANGGDEHIAYKFTDEQWEKIAVAVELTHQFKSEKGVGYWKVVNGEWHFFSTANN